MATEANVSNTLATFTPANPKVNKALATSKQDPTATEPNVDNTLATCKPSKPNVNKTLAESKQHPS